MCGFFYPAYLLGADGVDPIRFNNVAQEGGIAFVLDSAMSEEKHMIETMVGGVAVFDYDGDGLPDSWEVAHGLDPRLEW